VSSLTQPHPAAVSGHALSTPVDPGALADARARLLPRIEAALQLVLDRQTATPPGHLLPRGGSADAPPPPLAPHAPGHYGMMRYHLGWLDEHLAPVDGPAGKRLRPLLCLLAAETCGGSAEAAMPTAVALELLHNFSLIHDDIEDGDALRHHRSTVWKLWGHAQAINAGDGMHVLAYLALMPLADSGASSELVLRLVAQLGETALVLTEGQHLDLAFERRDDVSPAEYLDMIARKSAALFSCATAAGAEVACNRPAWQAALTNYGYQLGMGFQIRDDLLGIWGAEETTGKPAGDLYRRKKTLPTLYALSRAEPADQESLRRLFSQAEPGEEDVALALTALDHTGARRHCEQLVSRYSLAAREHLSVLPASRARDALHALAVQLETRES
jgi:geranylgeranyl diphosphate synthase type I